MRKNVHISETVQEWWQLTDVSSFGDVAAVGRRVEVVHLVVDLQVPEASGISGVHLEEVIRVPEVPGSAKHDRLSEGDAGKQPLKGINFRLLCW